MSEDWLKMKRLTGRTKDKKIVEFFQAEDEKN